MSAKRSASNLYDHAGYWLRYVSNHVSQAFAAKLESKGVSAAGPKHFDFRAWHRPTGRPKFLGIAGDVVLG